MTRHLLVAALFVLSLITYIDRAAISSAKDSIASDLALSDQAMGAVFSAFALGYALAQVPSGWFADRAGPRLMLSTVVALWSLLTLLTGAVNRFATLLAVRFLFGVAEAGAFPGAARAFYNWLPAGERGRANGIMFSGSRLGAAFAFPLMAWLLAASGWRAAFFLLALPGLVWAAGWFLWFRNHPRVPPPPEQAAPGDLVPFRALIASPRMLLAMLQYFGVNFTTFLCLSWMLPYLKERYALSAALAAWYSMAPLLLGASAQWIAGFLVDGLYRSPWRSWSRRLPAILGFALSALGIALVLAARHVDLAVAGFTLAAFGADLTISPSWVFAMDIGGARSGALTGAMNMMGNLGSFASANLFPLMAAWSGSPASYFWFLLALDLSGILCWLGMKSPPPTPCDSPSRSEMPAPPPSDCSASTPPRQA